MQSKFETRNLRSHGAVAQLGERLYGIQEVVGSNPISSTFNFRLQIDNFRLTNLGSI